YIETVPKLGYRLMRKPQRPTSQDAGKSRFNTRWWIYLAGVLATAFSVVIILWRPNGLESGVPEPASETVAESIAMPEPPSGELAGARNGAELTSQQGTRNTLAAFDEFSLGLAAYLRMTPDDNDLARAHYLRAIELDPDFARAYAGTALTWMREVMDGWTNDSKHAIREASRYVTVAETIDRSVPQVYFVKGLIALFQRRHLAAAEAAHHATRLDPNYADAYALLAWTLHHGGRPDVAIDALHEALRLNPESSASFEVIAGEINFSTGRYDEAIACFRNALDRNPTHSRARLWLTASLAQIEELDDARWELDELLSQNPDFSFEHTTFGLPQKDPEVLSRFFRALGRVRRLD
ncbi:MAG: tetratricopeptide repeat protein, partial [Chromatiaceae bacterium]